MNISKNSIVQKSEVNITHQENYCMCEVILKDIDNLAFEILCIKNTQTSPDPLREDIIFINSNFSTIGRTPQGQGRGNREDSYLKQYQRCSVCSGILSVEHAQIPGINVSKDEVSEIISIVKPSLNNSFSTVSPVNIDRAEITSSNSFDRASLNSSSVERYSFVNSIARYLKNLWRYITDFFRSLSTSQQPENDTIVKH